MSLSDLSTDQLAALHAEQQQAYQDLVARGLKLDLTRGKPSAAQLDLSNELLPFPAPTTSGLATGSTAATTAAARGWRSCGRSSPSCSTSRWTSWCAGGNASLAIMHDTLVFSLLKGTVDSAEPWGSEPVTFLCPVPGYDRHFALCEQYGIAMVSVPMYADGPDLDQVERPRGHRPERQGHLGRARPTPIRPAPSTPRRSPERWPPCRRPRRTSGSSGTTRTRCTTCPTARSPPSTSSGWPPRPAIPTGSSCSPPPRRSPTRAPGWRSSAVRRPTSPGT